MTGHWIRDNALFNDLETTVHDVIDILIDQDVLPEDFNDRWIDRPDLEDPGNIH